MSMSMSTVNLESFSAQLPTAADPFDLCLQTLSLDIFLPDEVPDVNTESGLSNALPVKQQVRSWRTFAYPGPKSASGRVLTLFSDWFLSLSHEERFSVFRKHMKIRIKKACRKAPDNLESICRLISLLHLQPYIDHKLCFTPVLIAGPNHQNLITDYVNGCDAAKLLQVQSDLNRLISNEKRIDAYSQKRNAQVTESRSRVQECLDRCSDLLSKMDPLLTLAPPPTQAPQEQAHPNGPEAQLKPQDRKKLTKLWTEGRENLVTALSQLTFPSAADPFSLCMELINALSQSKNTWATFRFPKENSYCGAVLEAFSKWFHSVNADKRRKVFRGFIKKPIIDACNAGNFSFMCRLGALLKLQRWFEPDLFLIPTHMQSHSQFVIHYLKGCDEALCQKFTGQLDALLLLNEDELAKFSQQCYAPVTVTHEKLADDIGLYQRNYGLKDAIVPNLIARKNSTATSGQAESAALSVNSMTSTDASVDPVSDLPMHVSKLKQLINKLWNPNVGRTKVIEILTKDHFASAEDPFKLCLELVSQPSWGRFRFPKKSSHYGTVFEAYTIWFGTLENDSKKYVFDKFMKQAIIDGCQCCNFAPMCRLLASLGLFEQFENEEDLFLIPTQFQGKFQFVEEYLAGCSQALRQRFVCKLDALLGMSENELALLSQKYSGTDLATPERIERRINTYQQKYNFPDSLFRNLMARKITAAYKETSESKSIILLSLEGPWKHLSLPQRRIELYKTKTHSKE